MKNFNTHAKRKIFLTGKYNNLFIVYSYNYKIIEFLVASISVSRIVMTLVFNRQLKLKS
jgi:hypothetical protein